MVLVPGVEINLYLVDWVTGLLTCWFVGLLVCWLSGFIDFYDFKSVS